MKTPSRVPAAWAAADRASALAASSTATITSARPASSASARSLSGPATVLTTKMWSSPESTRTIASHTVATDSPIAPASTCSRLSCGLLWTLMCGRIFAGMVVSRPAIVAMFRFAAGRSRMSAGVTTSDRCRPMAPP